ncbi:hypothetical protein C8R46DRAFT_1229496 [Mycena filopes]|nr:hypothetical protein C8R46DRAFT_1229496 [Mycena filopes]
MSFSMVSFGDIVAAAELALKIVQVLYESPKSWQDYQDAMAELVSLHHELVLISDAVHLASEIGAVVCRAVAAEVARCYTDMQRFLEKTQGVGAKGLVGALNRVWWAATEEKELRVLRAAVARHRSALGLLLGSSNLIISTATRDEVRACRDTIQELSTTLKPVPHHVVEDMVFIVDPLGDVIRISLTYSLKYLDLHRIIQAYYPESRAGSRHISDGAYRLLHSVDGRVLARPAHAELQAGTTLEMSMLLRERANFLAQRRRCPRCKQTKSGSELVAGQKGWRKCLRCSKFFQVTHDQAPPQIRPAEGDEQTSSRFMPRKEGPQVQNTDDDGMEHFRRIELVCVEVSTTAHFIPGVGMRFKPGMGIISGRTLNDFTQRNDLTPTPF